MALQQPAASSQVSQALPSWDVDDLVVLPWDCPDCDCHVTDSYDSCKCGFRGLPEFSVVVPPEIKAKAMELEKADRWARLRKAFGGKTTNIFTPVIHSETLEQTMRNVAIALDSGADGIWLINHAISFYALADIGAIVRETYPELFIGINALGESTQTVFSQIAGLHWKVDGIWTDSSNMKFTEHQPAAVLVSWARAASGWQGLYFGGTCFKYQRDYTQDAAKARHVLDAASYFVDVLVTSGPGTGQAMPVWKGKILRDNAANVPTAIASGISIDNLQSYAGYTDVFMVASSIGRTFSELDADKVRELADAIHALPTDGPPQS